MKDLKTEVKEALIVRLFLFINGIEESLYQTNEEFMNVVDAITDTQTENLLRDGAS